MAKHTINDSIAEMKALRLSQEAEQEKELLEKETQHKLWIEVANYILLYRDFPFINIVNSLQKKYNLIIK